MRRFAASIVACSALVIGLGAGTALGEDYYCPPDAKFCPAPGLAQSSAAPDAVFGLDDSGAFGSNSQFAVHASQLQEGEKLIMVAPSTGAGMAMLPMDTPSSPMLASASAPQAMGGYNASAYASSYAPSPVYTSGPGSGGSDMDFIPPPPGSPRPSPSSYGGNAVTQAPAPRQTQAAPVYQAAAPSAAHESAYQSSRIPREEYEPRVAAAPAPAARQSRESVKLTDPAARVAPTDSPLAPSPDSFSQGRRPSARDTFDDEPASRRSAESRVTEKPAKKKRADMLSEVANETSRKGDKKKEQTASKSDTKDKKDKKEKRDKKEKASSDDRVPWWKGGMWRNRGR